MSGDVKDGGGARSGRTLLIIPAHNEASNLSQVIREVRAFGWEEVLVSDDGSTDHSARVLKGAGVRWLSLQECLGVGGAMRAALRLAREDGYRCIVRVDGDGQHPGPSIRALVGSLESGEVDAAVGSRYGEGSEPAPAGWRRWAQRGIAAALSTSLKRRVTDPTSGFWAFGPRAIDLLADHHPTGYAEPELYLLLERNGLKVTEVPVTMRPRLSGKTSLTWRRVAAALARILLALMVVPWRSRVRPAAPQEALPGPSRAASGAS